MRVLLVEDHSDTRGALVRVLQQWGHDVAAAGDLRAGLECLRTGRFDAIVSDIALPDGSGYALMTAARHSGSKALGIALSAYNYPQDVHEPNVTGFDYHLSKPCDCMQLRALLEERGAEYVTPASPDGRR